MADPLRPMKTFLGKTLMCGFLGLLPIILLEGMWSDPHFRELARKLDGSAAMWISLLVYLLIVFLLWCRWVARPDPE